MKKLSEILDEKNVFKRDESPDGVVFDWFCNLDKRTYLVIVSNGLGWNHVSLSHKNCRYVPTWQVMCKLKDLCFNDDDVVMQLHPKKSEYVNHVSNCLHLWQPQNEVIPTPPSSLV